MKRFIAGYLALAVLLTGLALAWIARTDGTAEQPDGLSSEHAVVLLLHPETGQIQYANDAAMSYYGYSWQQLQQMTLMDLTVDGETDAQLPTGTVYTTEHRLSNGTIRTVEILAEPLHNGNGGPLMITIRDGSLVGMASSPREDTLNIIVTIIASGAIVILLVLLWLLFTSQRRIRADKEEIENLNAQREMFMDAGQSLIYLKDENLCYLLVNEALARSFGKSKAEIIGRDDFALFEEAFAKIRHTSDMDVLHKNKRIVSEYEWAGRVFHFSKYPVPLTGGRTGVGAVVSDVTEARAEQRRREMDSHRNAILSDIFTRTFDTAQDLLDYALHESLKLTHSQYGYIYLYDENKQEFTLNSWTRGVMDDCAVADPQTVYHLDKTGLWGDVVRKREPIIVNEFQNSHPAKKGYPNGHIDIETFLSVPIIIDDTIVATIGLANKQKGYSKDDVDEVKLLMSGVWSALQRHQARETLTFERNKFLQTLLSIDDGVMVVDHQGTVEMMNRVAKDLTGWALDDAHGRHYTEIFILSRKGQGQDLEDPIREVLQSGQPYKMANPAVLIAKDGRRYDLEDSAAPVFNDNDCLVGAVLVFRDVTEKIEQQKRIEYLSLHDSLTGLYNRRFYEAEMDRLDTPRNLPLAVIMGDVNNLKLTNDIFGHDSGDELLQSIAEVFSRTCRSDDIIARWGGDEFVLLLPNTGEAETERIMQRIKTEFSKISVKGIEGSISMGYSIKSEPIEDIHLLFHQAEERMYAIKSIEHERIQAKAMDAIIRSLNLLSESDKQHAAHVSELCADIGRTLNLSTEDVRRLANAGYLHDIGKIAMRPDFINKVLDWSDAERKDYRRHPLIGHRILSLFDPSQILAEAVLAHHEHWDGTGYPKGISGENIPLMARIIRVAEYYDRATKFPIEGRILSPREALDAIREKSGGMFDPKIADRFIRIMEGKLDKEQEDG